MDSPFALHYFPKLIEPSPPKPKKSGKYQPIPDDSFALNQGSVEKQERALLRRARKYKKKYGKDLIL